MSSTDGTERMAGANHVILLEQIMARVRDPRPVREKRAELLQVATADDRNALLEFASWFRSEEVEGEE